MQSPQVSNVSVHYAPEQMEAAFEAFRNAYPDYASTHRLDELRVTEYARLDQHGHIYRDYTGGGLYAESPLREHMALLSENVFGNPHSSNLTSLAMTQLVEQTRDAVLKYFHASLDEYLVIFTPNSTGALKLVGESYPFAPGDHYLLTADNHNSVNGIREFARFRGATVTYIPVVPPDLRVDEDELTRNLELPASGANHLFAYPAQSNFSGCSTHWNGSRKRKPKAGMFCWMLRHLRPPTRSISANGIPTLWTSRSTKSSAIRSG